MAEGNGPTSEYVVQVEKTINEGSGQRAWIDIATVAVPPRTKRRTILERAFAENPAWRPDPQDDELRVRVLDAESAAATPVGAREQDPLLVIG
jgi:hypothetical protein